MPLFNPPAIFSGSIIAHGSTTIPTGYTLCDGTAISRTTFADLFNVIGTTYGTGDGSTTFNVPDMRQRFVLGKAASGTGATLGATGGTIDHVHGINPPNTTSGPPSATSAATAITGSVASATHTHDVDIPQFNSGQANPPWITTVYIIKN